MTMEARRAPALYQTDNMALAALLHLHDFPYRATVGRPSDRRGVWLFTIKGRLKEAVELIDQFENGLAAVEPVSFQRAVGRVRDDMKRFMDSHRGQSSQLRRSRA